MDAPAPHWPHTPSMLVIMPPTVSQAMPARLAEKTITRPTTRPKTTVARPPLYKVILLNDDFTPREFVVQVLKAVFRMGAERAQVVMLTAHKKGSCVIAIYSRDVAETKAKEATELGKQAGYPLFFTTEPEE